MAMILKTEKIIKEWTDYNKHMNVAYYIHVFDIAADVMLGNFKMGGESAKKDKKSTFVVEMHTHYNQEVKLDEEVETHLSYIDHDKKRIQYKLSMFHKEKKYLAATNEVLSLYMDLNQRRVTEFDPDRVKIMDDYIKNNSSKFDSAKLFFSSQLFWFGPVLFLLLLTFSVSVRLWNIPVLISRYGQMTRTMEG